MTVHFYINSENQFSWNRYEGQLPNVGDCVAIPFHLRRKFNYGHATVYLRIFSENYIEIYLK